MDCTVHGILQARILEWVAYPLSRGSFQTRNQPGVFCIAGKFLAHAGDPGSIPRSGRSSGEGIGYPLQYTWVSLVAQLVKNHLQCGRPGFDPWVGKIPWRRERLPTPVFWPGEFHGLYSPWGRKESDTTEQLSLSFTDLQGA